MTRFILIAAPIMVSCAAFAQPPVPSLSPTKLDQPATDTISDIADIDQEVRETLASLVPDGPAPAVAADPETALFGQMVQGGLVTGKTVPGSTVELVTYGAGDSITDRRAVPVDELGNFLFGFDRDHGPKAILMVTYPGQTRAEPKELRVGATNWVESRIEVPPEKADPYKQSDLDKIAADTEKKTAARRAREASALWATGFAWPADGCVSSRFGSRRIVNGTPRRYHSGVDVAAPDGMLPSAYVGTEVRAPADGVVRLADGDMFFEGGLIFIDHGQQLESALMHLSSVDVAVGQRVRQGEPLGKVGATGRVTGPHLHWSLKWQDRLLDPTTVVPELAACTD